MTDDILDMEDKDDDDKMNFVKVYGIKEARRAVSDKTALALTQLSSLDKDVSFLRSLTKHLSIRKN